MDHAHAVRIGKPVGSLRDDGEALAHRDRTVAFSHDLVERVSAHPLHDHVEVVALGQQREQRRNVGVVEPGEAGCFRAKSLAERLVAQQFRAQRLNRDLAIEHRVEGGMHLPDAAFAEQLMWIS
jgi:hypothetical protein